MRGVVVAPETGGSGMPEVLGLACHRERPEKFGARKPRHQSTKFYAIGCFPSFEIQKCSGWVRNRERRRLDVRPREEGRRWEAD